MFITWINKWLYTFSDSIGPFAFSVPHWGIINVPFHHLVVESTALSTLSWRGTGLNYLLNCLKDIQQFFLSVSQCPSLQKETDISTLES